VDGLIVKERDDRISASRYALMMLRFARTKPNGQAARNPPIRSCLMAMDNNGGIPSGWGHLTPSDDFVRRTTTGLLCQTPATTAIAVYTAGTTVGITGIPAGAASPASIRSRETTHHGGTSAGRQGLI
jgi:hypothetical protein